MTRRAGTSALDRHPARGSRRPRPASYRAARPWAARMAPHQTWQRPWARARSAREQREWAAPAAYRPCRCCTPSASAWCPAAASLPCCYPAGSLTQLALPCPARSLACSYDDDEPAVVAEQHCAKVDKRTMKNYKSQFKKFEVRSRGLAGASIARASGQLFGPRGACPCPPPSPPLLCLGVVAMLSPHAPTPAACRHPSGLL